MMAPAPDFVPPARTVTPDTTAPERTANNPPLETVTPPTDVVAVTMADAVIEPVTTRPIYSSPPLSIVTAVAPEEITSVPPALTTVPTADPALSVRV